MTKLDRMGLKIDYDDFALDLQQYIEEGEMLQQYDNYEALCAADDPWITNVKIFLKEAFKEGDYLYRFSNAGKGMFIMGYSNDKLGDHKKWLRAKLDVLIALKKNEKYLKPMNDLARESFLPISTLAPQNQSNKKVFIVHGRNELYKTKVARLIEKLGLKPVILHEQSNSGKTIIEKFENNADVGFAVIILSGDDEGRLQGAEDFSVRARQNVILEMGYFIGRLGREKVCLLKEPGVEEPSDMLGVVYDELDVYGRWELALAKELKAAGYEIDLNNI